MSMDPESNIVRPDLDAEWDDEWEDEDLLWSECEHCGDRLRMLDLDPCDLCSSSICSDCHGLECGDAEYLPGRYGCVCENCVPQAVLNILSATED